MLYRKLFVKILKHKRFIKFFISGSISAFVSIFTLFLLHGLLQVQVVLSASIAFILAFLVNFSLQKFWAFSASSDEGRTREQMIKTFIVGIFGLGINAGGMYLLVEILFIWYILAQIILSSALAFLNYFLYKIIFTKKDLNLKKQPDYWQIKNILIATGVYPPDLGGPATYSKILKDELPSFAYNIKVVSYGESSEDGVYKISRQQNILLRYFKYFLQVWKLAKWADLVYVQGPVSEGLPSYLACRLRRKKYILKVVGDFAWEQGQQRAGVEELLDEFQKTNYSLKVELWRLIEIFVTNGALLIITPSEYLKKIVKLWGVENDKIKVIYNSVRKISFATDKHELKNELAIPDNMIISVSRLVPWKGFETLIDCVSEINKTGQEIDLYIAGEGPDKDVLEKKIKNLGIESKVKLLGKLEQDKLWVYMRASDAFVLNTAYEGLSHLLIEAMALEIPIVTTDVGGNGELIENNKNGLLVEYNNKEEIITAIKRILNNKDLANDLSRQAKIKAEKFTKIEMLQNIDSIFKKI